MGVSGETVLASISLDFDETALATIDKHDDGSLVTNPLAFTINANLDETIFSSDLEMVLVTPTERFRAYGSSVEPSPSTVKTLPSMRPKLTSSNSGMASSSVPIASSVLMRPSPT